MLRSRMLVSSVASTMLLGVAASLTTPSARGAAVTYPVAVTVLAGFDFPNADAALGRHSIIDKVAKAAAMRRS